MTIWIFAPTTGQNLLNQNIEVLETDGSILKNPFAGGQRAPQFNLIDLNFDGVDDLLVFDRAGDVLTAYLKEGDEFVLANHLLENFPKFIEWISVVDYDGDGIMDVFSFPTEIALPGVQVWKGSVINGLYTFESLKFPEEDFDILFVPIGSRKTQVFVSVTDIPVIKDIDDDGDIDIIAFNSGGSTVDLYENRGIDDFNDASILSYVIKDQCYGRFLENAFSQDVLLSKDGQGCGNAIKGEEMTSPRHAGSTIELMDVNGDDRFDILLGDISYNGINLLTDGGEESPWITSSQFGFPSSDPIEIELFLTPRALDIDNDGMEELIISPNEHIASQTKDNIWLFENDAENGLEPRLVTKNFLSENMLDFGEYAIPVFTDYNQDGLMDIVIGTNGRFVNTSDKDPRLILLENIGNTILPKYQIVDLDYLGMNEFKSTSQFFAPTFGDLDGDGDLDAVIGDNRGRLYFYQNMAGVGQPFSFSSGQYEYQQIQVSGFARPLIYDLNADGLGDLIIGERNFNSTEDVPIASLNYFQNTGSPGSPSFDPNVNIAPNNPALGAINLKEPGFINNNSSISIWKNQDETILVTGSETGSIRRFKVNTEDITTAYEELIDDELNKIDVGIRSAPSISDINADGFLELVVGNFRGGISIFETSVVNDNSVSTNEEIEIKSSVILSPNPVANVLLLAIDSTKTENAFYEIFDITGRSILEGNGTNINVSQLRGGAYLIRILVDNEVITRKFIKM